MSIQLVMPNNHLILCCPFLLLPSTFPSIRVFSNDGKVWWSSLVKCVWPDVLGKCVFGVILASLMAINLFTSSISSGSDADILCFAKNLSVLSNFLNLLDI